MKCGLGVSIQAFLFPQDQEMQEVASRTEAMWPVARCVRSLSQPVKTF